jgi:hypothetical protein
MQPSRSDSSRSDIVLSRGRRPTSAATRRSKWRRDRVWRQPCGYALPVRLGWMVVVLAVIAGCGGAGPQRSDAPHTRTRVAHVSHTASRSGYRIVGTPLVTLWPRWVSPTLIFVVVRLDRALPEARAGRTVAATIRVDDSRARPLTPSGPPAEHCYFGAVRGSKTSPTLHSPREGQPVSVTLQITGVHPPLAAPARLEPVRAFPESRRQERAHGCTGPRPAKSTYSIDEPTPTPTR